MVINRSILAARVNMEWIKLQEFSFEQMESITDIQYLHFYTVALIQVCVGLFSSPCFPKTRFSLFGRCGLVNRLSLPLKTRFWGQNDENLDNFGAGTDVPFMTGR